MPQKNTKAARRKAAKPKPPAEEPQEAAQEPQKPMWGPPLTEPTKSKPLVAVPAEGSLIRQDGTPVVYVMQGGKKRPILDGAAMDSCGFGWPEIAVLPYEVVAPIPVGEIVTRPKDLQGA